MTRGRYAWVFALLLVGVVGAWALWPTQPIAVVPSTVLADAAVVAQGRYLTTLGNCQTCHTPRGGAAYGGGRAFPTPFGVVYSSNLTPAAQGLQAWSAADFWRAMHHGQSRDGRWLYPAFPYTNTTHITRTDSDALFAYLRSLPPVATKPPAHQLDWPFSTQLALQVWRALYFSAAPNSERVAGTDPAQAEVARGAYLVRGLGHCSACHAERNALGANSNMLDLAGGLIPMQNWYAPSLADPAQAGVQDWPVARVVELFRTGRSQDALVTGPMSAVVQHSTQYWTEQDLHAMARYLQQLPRSSPTPEAAKSTATPPTATGAALYHRHCAQCHGDQGQGVRLTDGQFAYPPLAANRAVTMASPANLVQMVANGGFAPATQGHSRPFGMPPFVLTLNDGEMAAVLTHVRTQWGNAAAPVSALEVRQLR